MIAGLYFPKWIAVNPSANRPRGAKYGNLDWGRQKAVLKRLYIDENESLIDTMNIMEKHSFDASSVLAGLV